MSRRHCRVGERQDYENLIAEEEYITRREMEFTPAVSIDTRTCAVCLEPSSFSPCQRCTDSEYGPLGRRDQTW